MVGVFFKTDRKSVFPLTSESYWIMKTLFVEVDKIDKDSADLESALSLTRQRVLNLAIRGRLVPQDPSDEPASELLKKIKVEKEALVKTRKIKKDKHESFIFKRDDNRPSPSMCRISGFKAERKMLQQFFFPLPCREAEDFSGKAGQRSAPTNISSLPFRKNHFPAPDDPDRMCTMTA